MTHKLKEKHDLYGLWFNSFKIHIIYFVYIVQTFPLECNFCPELSQPSNKDIMAKL